MAAPSIADRLRHILDAIARVQALTAGKDLSGYRVDWVVRDAVERNLERLSEASRHIPASIKSEHTSIRWRALAGLGNVLRHEYPSVADERVWEIIADDLVPLKNAIDAILQHLERGDGG
jgi:uncharacterized protein with HEPN domain